jgi:mannitol-1-/sugar-/sorbitol-6-phosphatase
MLLTNEHTAPFEGIAFDMDGTLVDSTLLIEGLWRRWASSHAIDVEALLIAAHGRKAVDTVRLFAPAHLDPVAEALKLTNDAADTTQGLKEVRGSSALLRSLPSNRSAIVTSADRRLATKWLDYLGLPLPEILISAEDVSEGKPSPFGYLEAAKRLNCDPSRMIVFEDAQSGMMAGEQAGAHVIALSTSIPPQQLVDHPYIPDFERVRVEEGALIFL